MNALQIQEDEIGRKLAQAHALGELQSAPGFGKPWVDDEGWAQTPDDLRMGFKILKNAGIAPPEIALFHERAALRVKLERATLESERRLISNELSELEQRIALRLEALRTHGSM